MDEADAEHIRVVSLQSHEDACGPLTLQRSRCSGITINEYCTCSLHGAGKGQDMPCASSTPASTSIHMTLRLLAAIAVCARPLDWW